MIAHRTWHMSTAATLRRLKSHSDNRFNLKSKVKSAKAFSLESESLTTAQPNRLV